MDFTTDNGFLFVKVHCGLNYFLRKYRNIAIKINEMFNITVSNEVVDYTLVYPYPPWKLSEKERQTFS